MSNKKYNLVFDQGGHATRAILFDNGSNILKHYESPIATQQIGELIVEHDANELITSFHSVLDQLYSDLGYSFKNIESMGMATQRSSFVCWDKLSGEALTPVISWQDRRTLNELDKYQKHMNEIHQKTGLYLNSHYGASKMRWCLDNLENVIQAKQQNRLCIGPLSSYVLFHLLQNSPFVVDPANASRTLMMDYKSLRWDEGLCNLFGISQNLLPEIKASKSNYGQLIWQNHKIPMHLCTGDQSAAAFGNGKPHKERIYINTGTGAFIQNIGDDVPDMNNSRLLASVVFTSDSEKIYALEGTVNGAGRALQWLSDKTGIVGYEKELDDWCEQYSSPTIFLNGISGVGSPFWVADFESYFVNNDISDQEKFVAVLESIVFLIYSNVKTMLEQKPIIEKISISGGVAKSNALCQKLADLSGLIIERDEQSEATAKGVQYLMKGNTTNNRGVSLFHPERGRCIDERFMNWLKKML